MQNLYNPDETSTEPLRGVGLYTALASAAIGVAVAFGLHISDDQKAAIVGVVAVVAPLVVAELGRRRAYAPATVAKLLRR